MRWVEMLMRCRALVGLWVGIFAFFAADRGQEVRSQEVQTANFVPLNTQAAGEEPLPPDVAAKRLHVPEGFQVTLAAAEPQVRQPIAITFDDRGRLWVAESYSYDGSTFTDLADDRILIFEDTTGNGVLDRRRVFCDGLTHLTGLEVGFGGVWITAPPHLAFIPDRDFDDVPDGDPEIHLDGWSLKAEHNSVNGLDWGPDGWLYGRHGIKQPSLVGRVGAPPERRVALSCCIWRYQPTRQLFEVVADGTINPWGLDFDDHGQAFFTTSVVEHLWHLVPGAHYQRWKDRGVNPNPFVYQAMTATSDHLHWGSGTWDKAGRMAEGNQDFGGGHSHCDAMIYLGDRWPKRYRGALLTSNIHGRRINCDRIVRDAGSEYRGTHADDFLVVDDPWFRAVSLEYGPDGDVYVTDWSDNGECHDRDGVHRTSGRIYKITYGNPKQVRVDLQRETTKQLVAFQFHPNEWYVRHARRVLQERAAAGEDLSQACETLRNAFASEATTSKKLRALWALNACGGADQDWLAGQLNHDDEHVRAWAVRLLFDRDEKSTPEVLSQLAEMSRTEPSWLVRMTIASAIGRVDTQQRWSVCEALAGNADRWRDSNLERMIWYAWEPTVAQDPARSLEIISSVTPNLRRWIARRITEASGEQIASLFQAIQNADEHALLVDLMAGFNDALARIDTDQLPDQAAVVVGQLLRHPDAEVRLAAVSAAATLGTETTLIEVRRLLHDPSVDSATASAALRGLVQGKANGLVNDLNELLRAGRLTHAVLQAAASVKSNALSETILRRYPGFSSEEKAAAIDALVARKASAKLLFDAIEQQVLPTNSLSASQARQIAALEDADLSERLEAVWGTVRKSSGERIQQIKRWESELTPDRLANADLENGRRVFQKTCASCHKLFGEGGAIGPELTGANRANLNYLLSNVIDPSAAVPADFRLAAVLMQDGRVVSGVILQQTESTLQIQTTKEQLILKKEDVESIKLSHNSLMPEGLLDSLNDDQVRDLFAWVMHGKPGGDATDQDSEEALPLVVLLGDSIRMSYQATVASQLEGKAIVWAPKENCRHTAYILEHLEGWLAGRDPAVIHINVGLHDMFLSESTGRPRHDVETYTTNLAKILERLQQLSHAKVIFANTNPVDEKRQAASQTYGRVVRRNEDVLRYNRAALEVAKASGATINDIHALCLKKGPAAMLRESDGIHLSKWGETVVGTRVAEAIVTELGKGPANASNAAAQPPDVLMIMVDDLRPMLGCYGDERIQTPNIDQLARRSVVFDRAYCQYAKCGTSRLSLMTGLRPDSIGVFSNRDRDVSEFRERRPDVRTLSKWLGEQGYHTRSFGKIDHDGWHVNEDWSVPPSPGRPQEMLEVVDPNSPSEPTVIAERLNCPVIQSPDVPDQHFFAGRMARQVAQTLREPHHKPLFLAVGFRRPHLPFVAPKKYFDLYQPDETWLAPRQIPAEGAPVMSWFNSDGYVGTARRVGLTMPVSPTVRQAIDWNGYELRSYVGVPNQGPIDRQTQLDLLQAYAACISYVDAQIGVVLRALKDADRDRSTVIVLCSDHGWHLGEQSAWGKMTNFEIATRVPLLISAPGIQPGRSPRIVELVDLYPTLCDLAGVVAPQYLEGDSLGPLLRRVDESPDAIACSQYSRFGNRYMGRAIRDDRFRFVRWEDTRGGAVVHEELYDHKIDAAESVNRIDYPEYRNDIDRLRHRLEQAFKQPAGATKAENAF